VIDQIGLANPLAAHTARIDDGRIRPRQNLFPDWAVAEGPFLKEYPYIPPYLNEDGWPGRGRAGCPAPTPWLNSVRAPHGTATVPSNLSTHPSSPSIGSIACRRYELERCGLEPPAPKVARTTASLRRDRDEHLRNLLVGWVFCLVAPWVTSAM